MTLNYQSTLLKTREEISMVVLGPFTNIIIFCLTVIFSWILQRLYGTSPNIFSRFIMAYGINVLLDPIWILIVDSALMRYDVAWVFSLVPPPPSPIKHLLSLIPLGRSDTQARYDALRWPFLKKLLTEGFKAACESRQIKWRTAKYTCIR